MQANMYNSFFGSVCFFGGENADKASCVTAKIYCLERKFWKETRKDGISYYAELTIITWAFWLNKGGITVLAMLYNITCIDRHNPTRSGFQG